jgi:TPR repeat protein
MKTKNCGFKFSWFTMILLVSVFRVNAADLTNTTAVVQESWETISNRWGNISLDNVKQAALKGDVSAQYYVGCAYKDGTGVSEDWAESFKWVNMAAQQGLGRAQRIIGCMYEMGKGTEKDPLKAETFYRKAALLGDAKGQLALGCMLQYGGAKETNLAEAVSWYKKSAEQGVPEAQRNLAYAYENGIVGSTNFEEAAKLMRLAAVQGDSEAQNNLGWLLANGQGVPKDYDEAANWFQKAADQGNKLAINNLTWLDKKAFEEQYSQAKKYQKGDGVPQEPVEAFKWMEKAAKHDQSHDSRVSDAIYYLALMCENGEGVQTNKTKARELLFQAAEGPQPDACYLVAQFYEKGEGINQDDYLAVRYYYNAMLSMGGHKFRSTAAESILRLYADGRGVVKTNQEPEDYIDRELANKPAVIGSCENQSINPTAHFYTGKIYFNGKLVPQDIMTAAIKFKLAANESVPGAAQMLEAVKAKMSPEQKDSLLKQSGNDKRKDEMKRRMRSMMD